MASNQAKKSKYYESYLKYWYISILAGLAGLIVASYIGYILGFVAIVTGAGAIFASKSNVGKNHPNRKKALIFGVIGLILGIAEAVFLK